MYTQVANHLVQCPDVDWFVAVQFPVVCDKVVHDGPHVVSAWEVWHVLDVVDRHVPYFGIFPSGFPKEVLVGFPRGAYPIFIGCFIPFLHISG